MAEMLKEKIMHQQHVQLTLASSEEIPLKALLESAMRSESKMIQLSLARTERNLRKFEQQYGMLTAEFYRQLTTDELQETLDFIEWAGEYKTLLRLLKKYQALQEIRFVN